MNLPFKILLAKWHLTRRGEWGVEWMGGPLWNPVWGTGMPAVPWYPCPFQAALHKKPMQGSLRSCPAATRPLDTARRGRSFSCFSRRESDSDQNLILCNSDVRQVGWLDAEVSHINGTRRCSHYHVPSDLSLHIKHLFVGFAVHRQVADELKPDHLSIAIGLRQALGGSRDERRRRIGVCFQIVLSHEVIAHRRICLQRPQIDGNIHRCDERGCTGSYTETALH